MVVIEDVIVSDEELIDGVYKLVMCIATGGSSQVWEVVEQASGRHLAMKLLKMDNPDFKENKAGLKHESEVLKSLDHPFIIKFEKFSSSRDATYMTMEHYRASNVKLQLKADMSSVHVRARRLFESVCQALSHVHSKGWVHRDIKPDNVLMNKVGEIRLVDFSLSSKEVTGFSKMMGGGKLKTIQGTRTYIAPETIRKQTPTFQTDLYSLGIMFFEVLTGKTPFQAPSPELLLEKHLKAEPPSASEFNPNVSPEMDRLIARLLKKKPADRHGTVDEVLGELKRIKIFKEEVTEESLARQRDEAKGDAMSQLTDIRLDSRADAKLKEMLASNPELARQFEADKVEKAAKKKAVEEQRKAAVLKTSKPATPASAPVPQPMPQPMPQPIPMGYPPPGYAPFPQMPMAGMPPMSAPPGMMPMMPGPPGMMPQPPFNAPGMMPPMPSASGMPPGAVPGAPGMPNAATRPVAPPMSGATPRPSPPAPAPQQPASPSRPVATAPSPVAAAVPAKSSAKVAPTTPAKPAPPPTPPAEELEFMTELPDIL